MTQKGHVNAEKTKHKMKGTVFVDRNGKTIETDENGIASWLTPNGHPFFIARPNHLDENKRPVFVASPNALDKERRPVFVGPHKYDSADGRSY